MDHEASEADFQGYVRIISRVTNSETEAKGGFLYIHNIARAAVYWWLCNEPDGAGTSDRVAVVCDYAIPSEPSEEPEVALGGETSVTFPVTIRRLDPSIGDEAMIAEAKRVVQVKVSEGGDDFEGLETFRVEFQPEEDGQERSAAA